MAIQGGAALHFCLVWGFPLSVKRWSEAQIGKPYRLYSHIFLPSFTHITPIIRTGLQPLYNWNFSLRRICIFEGKFR